MEVDDESGFKRVRSGPAECKHKDLNKMHNNTELVGVDDLKGLDCWK